MARRPSFFISGIGLPAESHTIKASCHASMRPLLLCLGCRVAPCCLFGLLAYVSQYAAVNIQYVSVYEVAGI